MIMRASCLWTHTCKHTSYLKSPAWTEEHFTPHVVTHIAQDRTCSQCLHHSSACIHICERMHAYCGAVRHGNCCKYLRWYISVPTADKSYSIVEQENHGVLAGLHTVSEDYTYPATNRLMKMHT